MDNHNHTHSHEHTHPHAHGGDFSPEETLALLKYMADHNEHHAEELHKIAHSVSPQAAELIHEAVELMNSGNLKLREALKIAEEE